MGTSLRTFESRLPVRDCSCAGVTGTTDNQSTGGFSFSAIIAKPVACRYDCRYHFAAKRCWAEQPYTLTLLLSTQKSWKKNLQINRKTGKEPQIFCFRAFGICIRKLLPGSGSHHLGDGCTPQPETTPGPSYHHAKPQYPPEAAAGECHTSHPAMLRNVPSLTTHTRRLSAALISCLKQLSDGDGDFRSLLGALERYLPAQITARAET